MLTLELLCDWKQISSDLPSVSKIFRRNLPTSLLAESSSDSLTCTFQLWPLQARWAHFSATMNQKKLERMKHCLCQGSIVSIVCILYCPEVLHHVYTCKLVTQSCESEYFFHSYPWTHLGSRTGEDHCWFSSLTLSIDSSTLDWPPTSHLVTQSHLMAISHMCFTNQSR